MSRFYPNNELDIDEIAKINENSQGLGKENDFEFITQIENNTFLLESYNASLFNKLPIFGIGEEEKLNNTKKDEKSPTDEKELYLIKKLNNLSISPPKLFKILNQKKRRGRVKQEKKQEEMNIKENEDNNYDKIHDKYTSDNLLRKVQVHYLSFIVRFLNEILKFLCCEQRFLNLNYEFKSNVNKKFFSSLKTKTIGDIISTQISVKYKKEAQNYNKNIFDQTKNNKILDKIYSENYSLFFKKIYFKSKREINLREYGLNKKIILSEKVEMYEDLLENKEYVYKRNIKKCVNQHFFHNSLFITE